MIQVQSYMWILAGLVNEPPVAPLRRFQIGNELARRQRQAEDKDRIGLLGEKLVVDHEVGRLERAGRTSLASRVEWRSRESASHDFDVLPFEVNGAERHIEVKATTWIESSGQEFYLTERERQWAEADPLWRVVRVWDVDRRPEIRDLGNVVREGRAEWDLEVAAWSVRRSCSR